MNIEQIEALGPVLTGLLWPLAVIVVALVIRGIIRRGGVSSISATKEGVVIGMNPVDTRANYQHAMDKRISAVDDQLYREAKRATKGARRSMVLAVSGQGMCAASKESVAGKLLDPLFDAVDDNDFKTHLAAPARSGYVEEKLNLTRERYEEAVEDSAMWCPVDDGSQDLRPWAEVEEQVRRVIERWADQVALSVERACKAKIEIYAECRPQFDAAKDSYMVGVIDACVAKNQGYVAGLHGPAAAA